MTNQEFLNDLNRRHTRLETELSALKIDLLDLQARLARPPEIAPVLPSLPPLPTVSLPANSTITPPPLPDVPAVVLSEVSQPKPPSPFEHAAAPHTEPQPASPGFELQFGRWLARIGVVFALFTLIFFSVLVHNTLYKHLGPWSKLTVLTLVSSGLIAAGLRLEKRDSKMIVYGRTLAGGGLACLYYTIYGAIYVPQLHVISSQLFGGFLLLAWSAGVLALAHSRKSELLSIFAISLAYFSSAITPGNGFSMTADLILAATAVIFLLLNAWTGLSYLCLIGTYLGFARQTVIYEGPLDFQWAGHMPFWPSAVYLTGAWLIFTAGILLSRTPTFAAGKRMAFLCLNNGAWVGLLIVAAWLGSYEHMGRILGATGVILLIAYALAKFIHPEARDLAGAYLAQGLALATGGIVIAYSGVTRGLLITIESVFLVASGAFSLNPILRIGGGIAAVLGAGFLGLEIVDSTVPHPWILAFTGALAMLANAWLARFGRSRARENADGLASNWIAASALYSIFALTLLVTGIVMHSPDDWIAPRLALASLVCVASIYVTPLVELPVLGQTLLVLAQIQLFADAIFGNHAFFAGTTSPQWTRNLVALVTMAAATWCPRQKRLATKGWLTPLTAIYALGMVAFCFASFHANVTEQTWMIEAALLSLVFLAYGSWIQLWTFMAAGQILLGLSIFTFLYPDNAYSFPWTWWASILPIAVVFVTGWIVRELLPGHFAAELGTRDALRIVARIYQSIAVGLLVRWVFGVAPAPEITLSLFALGTAFICGGLFTRSSYAVRSGLMLSGVGAVHYIWAPSITQENLTFTWVNAVAFALFLAQPALLRNWGRELISEAESWAVIIVSSASTWLFVSNSITSYSPDNLTLGWALFALALTIVGFASNERRQRWCGLAILVAAFVRVAVHDFWGFSDLGKVVTFLALTVICLGLSFLYYKFADRLKEWL
jgi:hypothetical protein